VRAGLKVCPVDVDPETLDFDFSQLGGLPEENLLCIVSSNLFGLVNDVRRIKEVAHAKGVFFVDDAAQALGASRNGYRSGSCGDVGLFSFGRGKAVTAIEGGLIVTNSEEMFQAIRDEARHLPVPSLRRTGWLLLQMMAYTTFLNPYLYWVPDSLPFLKLGATEFAPDFPVTSMVEISKALLPQLIAKVADMNRIRRNNAAVIARALAANPKLRTPERSADSQPTFIRFPVIAPDEDTRNRAVGRLRRAGIGATSFYPSAICDIPGIADHMSANDFHRPQAESLARRLLTLPTHPFVRRDDLNRMIAILHSV
jgi:dTDP-4-amino-4,6-dideoxygalactose transaminase